MRCAIQKRSPNQDPYRDPSDRGGPNRDPRETHLGDNHVGRRRADERRFERPRNAEGIPNSCEDPSQTPFSFLLLFFFFSSSSSLLLQCAD